MTLLQRIIVTYEIILNCVNEEIQKLLSEYLTTEMNLATFLSTHDISH